MEELIKELDIKEKEFKKLEDEDRKTYFYNIREEYNSYKINENELSIKEQWNLYF